MQAWLRHLNDLEVSLCRVWSQSGGRHPWLQQPFAIVSRLGDGVFWYSLMAALPLVYGLSGLQASLHMLLTGALALLLYKLLKGATRRPRPCDHAHDITALVPPLDQYSFPSGHTLHAVAFSTVAIDYFPELGWLLVPLTTLIALSRIVLGLHYPSDVLMGILIGLALGYSSILFV